MLTVQRAAWNERWPGYHAGLHRVVDWQWYGVVHGRVAMRIDDRQLELGPGESVLIPPNALRQPAALGSRDPTGYFWVIIDAEGGGTEDDPAGLAGIAGQVLGASPDLEPDVDALVAELRAEPSGDGAILIQALVNRLLIGLARHHRRGALPPPALNRGAERETVAAVERLIANGLHEPLTRAAIAARVHVSEAHLARVFRAETGTSIGAYLTRCRIERAKDLLLSTGESIARIAAAVGYGSYSHFTQRFRREVGVTPSAYRRARGRVWIRRE